MQASQLSKSSMAFRQNPEAGGGGRGGGVVLLSFSSQNFDCPSAQIP